MFSKLIVISAALLASLPATHAQNDNMPDSLSVILGEPFSCDVCATANQLPGTLNWCLCCFWDCGGYRDNCVSQHAFCGSPNMCGSMQMCDLFGGAPPDGAQAGQPSSFFQSDGITFKPCHGVVPPPKCSSQTCPSGMNGFTQVDNCQCSQDTLQGSTAYVGGEQSAGKICQVPLIDGDNDAYNVATFSGSSCTVEPTYCYCQFSKGTGKTATMAYSRCDCGASGTPPPSAPSVTYSVTQGHTPQPSPTQGHSPQPSPTHSAPHTPPTSTMKTVQTTNSWTFAPGTVFCDQTAWVCDSMPACSCVHDQCSFSAGSVHGHCSNHPSWPCTSQQDTICVCNDDKTKACSPRVPAPTPPKCSIDHDCVTEDGNGAECGCDVKCVSGFCVQQTTGNNNACHTGYVCVGDKCVPSSTTSHVPTPTTSHAPSPTTSHAPTPTTSHAPSPTQSPGPTPHRPLVCGANLVCPVEFSNNHSLPTCSSNGVCVDGWCTFGSSGGTRCVYDTVQCFDTRKRWHSNGNPCVCPTCLCSTSSSGADASNCTTATTSHAPTPTVTTSHAPTPTITTSHAPTPTVTTSHAPTPTVTTSPAPTPTVTTSPAPTPTVTTSPAPTPTVTTSHAPTPTVTTSPAPTPTVTTSHAPTPTVTTSPAPTPTVTTSHAPTPTVTTSPAPSPTVTTSHAPTPTVTTSPAPSPTATTVSLPTCGICTLPEGASACSTEQINTTVTGICSGTPATCNIGTADSGFGSCNSAAFPDQCTTTSYLPCSCQLIATTCICTDQNNFASICSTSSFTTSPAPTPTVTTSHAPTPTVTTSPAPTPTVTTSPAPTPTVTTSPAPTPTVTTSSASTPTTTNVPTPPPHCAANLVCPSNVTSKGDDSSIANTTCTHDASNIQESGQCLTTGQCATFLFNTTSGDTDIPYNCTPRATDCLPDSALGTECQCGFLDDCFCTVEFDGVTAPLLCIPNTCGDGVVESPETCDGGQNGNGPNPNQPCTAQCQSKFFACCGGDGHCEVHASMGNTPQDEGLCAVGTNGTLTIVYGSSNDTTCTATTCCGDGLIDNDEQCDLGTTNSATSYCTTNCQLREIQCCNSDQSGTCLQFQPNPLTGALPDTCIQQCTVATRCTAPIFFDVGTPCSLTCGTCVESTQCGLKPGCQSGMFQHMSCDSSKDCGGEDCVRVEDSCQADSQCVDCTSSAELSIPRKNRCMPCLVCTSEQLAATQGLTAPNAMVCCPVPSGSVAVKKRSTSWDQVGCLSNESPQTCRPQLSCMCNTCIDSCDFNISAKAVPFNQQFIANDQSGVELDNQVLFQSSQSFSPTVQATAEISEAMCRQLYNHACHLHPGSDIKTVTQPHNTSIQPQLYVKEFYDVFNIHASEREITVTYVYQRSEALDGFPTRIVNNIYYLIDARDDCCQPIVISPIAFDTEAGSVLNEDFVSFLVPYVGNYILVHSAAILRVNPPTQAYLNAIEQIRCINGTIGINYTAPQCPASLCNAQSCIDSRDCNSTSCSQDACDGDYYRCILGEPLLDRHAFLRNQVATHDEKFADRNFLPSGHSIDSLSHRSTKGGGDQMNDNGEDVCEGAKNGEQCILRTNNANDPLQCQLGTCTNSVCTAVSDTALFECDCKCPRQCKNQPDCEHQCFEAHKRDPPRTDGKFWSGFCLKGEGTCVCRLEQKRNATSTTSSSSTATTTTAPAGATTTSSASGTPSSTTASVRALGRETIRLVGYQSKLATLIAPDHVAEITTPITAEMLLAVMDAGEIRRMQLTIDAAGSQTTAPICADVERRSIVVSAGAHKQAIDATCARVDIAHKCLDGSASEILSGHIVVDRAVRAITSAARSAQAANILDAFENACCALVYFNALSDSCGTPADALSALDSFSVVRATDGVGPMCAVFDDGHVDRDLNELVVEQRLVEVRDANNRLVAVNIYVLPLARGGGYKVSYAISLRGASIQSVDDGANAACSERARAVMRETFDPASLASVLRGRKQFPEGTRVSMISHVEHTVDDSTALPAGVRSSQCTTIGGAKDDSNCPRTDMGDVAIIGDLRKALPPVQGDAIDQLLATGVRVDQSTNTHHKSPTVRSRFSSSTVVMLPPTGEYSALSAASVRFVLRNEDCGAAVLLLTPVEQRTLTTEPISLTIPPHSCPAWRWANEGVRLIQSDADDARICRGGAESGIVQCSSDTDLTCTSAGGDCAESPSVEGVPYRTAKAHFACKTCFTDSLCADEPTCANHACCQDHILHWYRYPSTDLVYAGHELNVAEEILKSD